MPNHRGPTVIDDLPDSIVIWEILVRLRPKDVFRCRAVCKSWRRSTSARDFLLEHHRHQPSLLVIKQYADTKYGPVFDASSGPPSVVFHDAGAGHQKLWPLLRYAPPPELHAGLRLTIHDCRDGLLIFSDIFGLDSRKRFFYVCNPATRQCAPLPQLVEHDPQIFTTDVAGLYLHHPSGEYRVLYICWSGTQLSKADFYITTIGSDEPSRFIGRPPPSSPLSIEQALLKGLPYSIKIVPVLHRGGMHWDLGRYDMDDKYYADVNRDIMVFDTAVETFRWLRRPAHAPLGPRTLLLEMHGALALFCARDGIIVDVFVMQDYEDEDWALRHRIDLSATVTEWPHSLLMVMINESEMLIELPGPLFHSDGDGPGRMLHCDIDGKVLEIMEYNRHNIQMTTYLLQESIVPLPLSETQQRTAVNNDSPFFLGH